MPKTATLSIRIEPKTKSQAEKIFSRLGLTMTDAVNVFFRQCIRDRALPFRPSLDRPEIPNDETLAAMREIEQAIADERAGKRAPRHFDTVEELFAELED